MRVKPNHTPVTGVAHAGDHAPRVECTWLPRRSRCALGIRYTSLSKRCKIWTPIAAHWSGGSVGRCSITSKP